jgi:hypothetical protein
LYIIRPAQILSEDLAPTAPPQEYGINLHPEQVDTVLNAIQDAAIGNIHSEHLGHELQDHLCGPGQISWGVKGARAPRPGGLYPPGTESACDLT